MWWLYKKTFENKRTIQYAYSRESEDLSGCIQFDIETGKVTVLKLCDSDMNTPKYGERKALEHFSRVVAENFPAVRKVCCG